MSITLFLCICFVGIHLHAADVSAATRSSYIEYKDLSKAQKKACRKIMSAVKKKSTGRIEVKKVYKGSYKNIVKIINGLNNVYFELYQVPEFEYYPPWEYDPNWTVKGNAKKVRAVYKKNETAKKKAGAMYKKIRFSSASKLSRARTIAKYVVMHSSYNVKKNHAYDLLTTGEGNCGAYAQLFRYLCRKDGIKSAAIVNGFADGVGHSWNQIVFNGKTYYFDLSCYSGTGDPGYLGRTRLWSGYKKWKNANFYEF